MTKINNAVWQAPPENSATETSYLGFVLFRGDENHGGVLFSRVADPSLKPGEKFWSRLGFSVEDKQKLLDLMLENDAVWVLSKLGVGIIYRRFHLWTGYYLYIHFHDEPKALFTLLRERVVPRCAPVMAVHGVPKRTEGPWDEPTMTRFSRHVDHLRSMKNTLESPHETEVLYLSDIIRLASDIALFMGFSLDIETETEETSFMPGHYARLAEGMLLYWLCATLMLSVNDRVGMKADILSRGRDRVLKLALTTVVDREALLEMTPLRYQLFMAYDHMDYKGSISGVETQWTADELADGEPLSQEKAKDGGRRYVRLTFHVDFVRDPFRDASPAFKVKSLLVYDEE